MPEAVRLGDVAESIVRSYLYGVVSRLSEADLPQDAWFRITTQRSVLSLEDDQTPIVDPVFEVLLVMPRPSELIGTVMTEVAAEVPGRVVVMPRAVNVEAYSKDYQIRTGWTQTKIPSSRGFMPELSTAVG